MSEVCYENIPTNAIEKLNSLISTGAKIGTMAFAPNGGWVIIKDQNGAIWDNIPSSLVERIRTLNQPNSVISTIAFAPNGGWVIVNELTTGRGLPDAHIANDGTFRLLTSQVLSYHIPCYMHGDIRACYKINEIQNFALSLCASGNSEACAANEKINEMITQGEYARLVKSVSRPIY